jgi:hypothetical protein
VDGRIYEPIKPLGQRYSFPIDLGGVLATLMQRGKIVGQGISERGWVKMRLESPLLSSKGTVLTLSKKGYMTQVVPLKFKKPIDDAN